MKRGPNPANLRERLEELYKKYNRPEFVHPDPLEFVRGYKNLADREIAALVASTLAYGRVAPILVAVDFVLKQMGPSPSTFLRQTPASTIEKSLIGFKHRFATETHMSHLLVGTKNVLDRYGSLEKCFLSGWSDDFDTIIPALPHFIEEIANEGDCGHLLPAPEKGSACKRINLMLRWLVRRDAVDPGGWENIPTAALIVPLDTHMKKIGTRLGFTARSGTGIKTALEISGRFGDLSPDDPVKYDFALTRLGIRKDGDINGFFDSL